MIASLGLLLLLSAAPASLQAAVPNSAALSSTTETSTAPLRSFEQISNSAIDAFKARRDDEAIKLFEQGLKLKPDWDDGLWYLEALLYDRHRFFEARDLLRHYLAQNPKRGQGWAMLGLCDYQLREYGRALDHLQRASELGLGDHAQLAETVAYIRAILLTRSGQFDESMKMLSSIRSLYLLQGDAGAQAQDSLKVATGLCLLGYPLLPEEIPQDRLEFVRKTGEAGFAVMEKHHEKATQIYQELEQEHPNEQGIHYQFGSMLIDDDMPAGVEEMRKAIALAPPSTGARLELARYFIHRAQPEQAQPYLDEVLKLKPLDPTAHMLNGEILASAGNAARAISEFETARKSTPDDSQLLWDLLRAYNAAGRQSDAAQIKTEIAKIQAKKQTAK